MRGTPAGMLLAVCAQHLHLFPATSPAAVRPRAQHTGPKNRVVLAGSDPAMGAPHTGRSRGPLPPPDMATGGAQPVEVDRMVADMAKGMPTGVVDMATGTGVPHLLAVMVTASVSGAKDPEMAGDVLEAANGVAADSDGARSG